jgi:hypothetical protein
VMCMVAHQRSGQKGDHRYCAGMGAAWAGLVAVLLAGADGVQDMRGENVENIRQGI